MKRNLLILVLAICSSTGSFADCKGKIVATFNVIYKYHFIPFPGSIRLIAEQITQEVWDKALELLQEHRFSFMDSLLTALSQNTDPDVSAIIQFKPPENYTIEQEPANQATPSFLTMQETHSMFLTISLTFDTSLTTIPGSTSYTLSYPSLQSQPPENSIQQLQNALYTSFKKRFNVNLHDIIKGLVLLSALFSSDIKYTH